MSSARPKDLPATVDRRALAEALDAGPFVRPLGLAGMGLTQHDSLTAAQAAASEAASASGGRVFTCVFKQGGRLMLTTAFNYAFLSRHVFPESAVKGGNPRLAPTDRWTPATSGPSRST